MQTSIMALPRGRFYATACEIRRRRCPPLDARQLHSERGEGQGGEAEKMQAPFKLGFDGQNNHAQARSTWVGG